jgi:hypothetical protein
MFTYSSHPTSQLTLVSTDKLGLRFWDIVPEEYQGKFFQKFMARVWRVIQQHGLAVPDLLRLQLIVMAAAEAEFLFRATAVDEPSQEDHDLVFTNFISLALQPPSRASSRQVWWAAGLSGPAALLLPSFGFLVITTR